MHRALMMSLVLILACITAGAVRALRLSWPANDPLEEVSAYHIYAAPNATGTWVRVATVTNTEWPLAAIGERMFYRVTAENAWGESDPSNVVNTPRAAGAVQVLQINWNTNFTFQ
jgi:hypothetical protein